MFLSMIKILTIVWNGSNFTMKIIIYGNSQLKWFLFICNFKIKYIYIKLKYLNILIIIYKFIKKTIFIKRHTENKSYKEILENSLHE